MQLRSGGVPKADDEATVNLRLARAGGFAVGDTLVVRDLERVKRPLRIVGTYSCDHGKDSCDGELGVAMSDAAVQRLIYGRTGFYDSVLVKVAHGGSADRIAAALRSRLGPSYDVKTGKQLGNGQLKALRSELRTLSYVLLGFGAVALLVGTFMILNTFSIIVAQRTRELALLRALGASRRQVRRSILMEAVADTSGESLDADALRQIRAVPQVTTTVAPASAGAEVNGSKDVAVQSVDDLSAARTVFGLRRHQGSIDSLCDGEVLVDQYVAKEHHLHVGDQVTIRAARGGDRRYRVVGVYKENTLVGGVLMAPADFRAGYSRPGARQVFVTVAGGTKVSTVRSRLEAMFADDDAIAVATRDAYIGTTTSGSNNLLMVVQALLLLAMVIAVLGVINTLVLSVLERSHREATGTRSPRGITGTRSLWHVGRPPF